MRQRKRTFLYILLFVWTLFVAFPIYWTVVTSLKTREDVIIETTYIPWVDFTPTVENYANTYKVKNVDKYLLNSSVSSLISTILAIAIGSMAAYGLARFSYKFGFMRNNDIMIWIISQRMMPPIVSVLALFIMYHYFRILDTRIGLIIAYTTFNLPIVVWLMSSFIKQVPLSLEEAARIDGASHLQVLTLIVLPTILPGIIASFLLCMIFAWNEYLMSLVLTFDRAITMPILIASQRTQEAIEWWNISALSVITILPVVIVFIFLQRHFIQSKILGWGKE
jgi:multiple sugar transport system permease protein